MHALSVTMESRVKGTLVNVIFVMLTTPSGDKVQTRRSRRGRTRAAAVVVVGQREVSCHVKVHVAGLFEAMKITADQAHTSFIVVDNNHRVWEAQGVVKGRFAREPTVPRESRMLFAMARMRPFPEGVKCPATEIMSTARIAVLHWRSNPPGPCSTFDIGRRISATLDGCN